MQPANIKTAGIIGAGRNGHAIAWLHLHIFLGCGHAACHHYPTPQRR